MPRKDPYREEARRLAREKEREKDMVYYVKFVRKNCGFPVQFFESIDGLCSDPEENPDTLKRAIEAFQEREKVSDWREIADRYECGGYWFG